MNWFRFYNDAIDDPKVQRLPGELFKTWVNLLCLASKNDGVLPDTDDIAFILRMAPDIAASAVAELVKRGLMEQFEGGYSPHNWSGRQKASDNVTARVQAFRERQRQQEDDVAEDISAETDDRYSETFHPENVKRFSNGLDKIEEIDKKEIEEIEGANAPHPPTPIKASKATRATRLPADFPVTDDMREWARRKFPELDIDFAHEEFCTYWRGRGGTNVDWHQTWQNGMLKAYARAKQNGPRYQTQADMNSGRNRKFVGA